MNDRVGQASRLPREGLFPPGKAGETPARLWFLVQVHGVRPGGLSMIGKVEEPGRPVPAPNHSATAVGSCQAEPLAWAQSALPPQSAQHSSYTRRARFDVCTIFV
jgi:hypothetical protein